MCLKALTPPSLKLWRFLPMILYVRQCYTGGGWGVYLCAFGVKRHLKKWQLLAIFQPRRLLVTCPGPPSDLAWAVALLEKVERRWGKVHTSG